MKYTIHIGNNPIVLEHENVDSHINVDDLTVIDVSNIFGEVVTASAAANRIGLLKAEVEKLLADKKLELKVFEGQYRSKLRKEAADNGGFYSVRVGNDNVDVKLTEKALETCYETDSDWISLKKQSIEAERNVSILTALYWAVQDKSRKLNNLASNVTPEEFIEQLVEGKVNGITIRKPKKL